MPQNENQSENTIVPECPNDFVRIFVYGSLRKGHYNHSRCLNNDAKFIGNASLKGFGLFSLGYFPAIADMDRPDIAVMGEIYDVPEYAYKRIDGMEIGAGYDRQQGEVRLLTGEIVNATYWDMPWEKLVKYYQAPLVQDGDWTRHEKEKGKLEV